MVNQRTGRDQYPDANAWYHQARYRMENSHEANRLGESFGMRRSPMTIKQGLELCGITGDNYFVVSETEGKCSFFSSPPTRQQPDYRRFFDEQAYVEDVDRRRHVDQADDDMAPEFSSMHVSPSNGDANRMRLQGQHIDTDQVLTDSSMDNMYRARKRRRAPSVGISKVPIQSKRSIEIGDEKAVYALYDQRLRFCQQYACKTIAKAWIKVLEPRKQSTHPYTRGNEFRPDWWPRQFVRLGSDVVQEMRHKEPDHLSRDERVALLCHILRLVVESPKTQHQAVRKANLDLNKLEAITFDTLSTWFSDKQAPNNLNKKPILREIFRVAKQEHSYKCGEIDPKTEVYVQAIVDPRMARGPVEDESDDENIVYTPRSSVGPPTESTVTMMMHHAQNADPGHAIRVPGNFIAGAMAMRTGHYTSPGVRAELAGEQVPYMEPSGIASHAPSFGHSPMVLPEPYPGSQGPSRRASMYNSPQDYGSPAPGSVYPSWQNLPSTASPTMYGFGSHLAPSHTHAPSALDGLQTETSSSSQHANVYGLRPIEQPALHSQQGYPSYVPDGAPMNGLDVKSEDTEHPQFQ